MGTLYNMQEYHWFSVNQSWCEGFPCDKVPMIITVLVYLVKFIGQLWIVRENQSFAYFLTNYQT